MAASGQVSASSWPGSSLLLYHSLFWHQQEVLGWLVCAWEEMTGGRLRTLGSPGRQAGGAGGLVAGSACGGSTPTVPEGDSSPTAPSPASLGAQLPLALAPVARGQPQMAPWPRGQRPHCARPWAGLGLGHTEPFCPRMGVRGRQQQGDRPFSFLPSPLTPQI